ncbi:hypothetical protein B4100_1826 [Heyndrickxia coagulans]|nr:hypothetical protein B4100_1826 [Heyndrickxia coagulans]
MDDPASLKLLTGTRRKLPGHKGRRKNPCQIWNFCLFSKP